MLVSKKSPQLLIYQANSVQGNAVVQQVIKRGISARVLIRNSANLPYFNQHRLKTVVADLQDTDLVDAAYKDIHYVIMQLPLTSIELVEKYVDDAIRSIKKHSIKAVIVKMASTTPSIQTDEQSFRSNKMILDKMESSGIPFSVLQPTMYLDTFLKPSLRQEICEDNLIEFPIAIDQKIAWTCVDDAAIAALTILENNAFGERFIVSGAQSFTGLELAKIFSEILGREITYQGITADEFEKQIDAALGAGIGKRVASKFRFFETEREQADQMLGVVYHPSPKLAGFAPTSIRDWISQRANLFVSDNNSNR